MRWPHNYGLWLCHGCSLLWLLSQSLAQPFTALAAVRWLWAQTEVGTNSTWEGPCHNGHLDAAMVLGDNRAQICECELGYVILISEAVKRSGHPMLLAPGTNEWSPSSQRRDLLASQMLIKPFLQFSNWLVKIKPSMVSWVFCSLNAMSFCF